MSRKTGPSWWGPCSLQLDVRCVCGCRSRSCCLCLCWNVSLKNIYSEKNKNCMSNWKLETFMFFQSAAWVHLKTPSIIQMLFYIFQANSLHKHVFPRDSHHLNVSPAHNWLVSVGIFSTKDCFCWVMHAVENAPNTGQYIHAAVSLCAVLKQRNHSY